jgi:hypothetical protein
VGSGSGIPVHSITLYEKDARSASLKEGLEWRCARAGRSQTRDMVLKEDDFAWLISEMTTAHIRSMRDVDSQAEARFKLIGDSLK